MSAPALRTSELLASLASVHHSERISLGEIFEALKHHAFGILILVFALPNCLPMIPGIPVITGLNIMALAIQIVIGLPAPWLPQVLARTSIPRSDLERLIARAMPWIERLERFSSPRLSQMTSPIGQRLIGLAIFLLAILMVLPVPFIGNIPPAIAIVILSFGLIARDGFVVIAGYLAGMAATAMMAGLMAGIFAGVRAII